MIYITWNNKKVIVYKNYKRIYTIYVNGRNPYSVYEEVKLLVYNKGEIYDKPYICL